MEQSVSSAIFDRLSPFFKSYEYEYLPQLIQFRKQMPQGFANVIISVSEYDDKAIVETTLGTRIHAVEEMVYKFTTGNSGFAADSNTCIVTVGKLLGMPYERPQIRLNENYERDIKQYCDWMEHFFCDIAFNLLERLSNAVQCDEEFNDKPEEPCLYIHNKIHRCLRGIVLAKIVHREDFLKLVASYTKELEHLHAPKSSRANFQRLAVYLKTMSLN
jgi:hypothetical protein